MNYTVFNDSATTKLFINLSWKYFDKVATFVKLVC